MKIKQNKYKKMKKKKKKKLYCFLRTEIKFVVFVEFKVKQL